MHRTSSGFVEAKECTDDCKITKAALAKTKGGVVFGLMQSNPDEITQIDLQFIDAGGGVSRSATVYAYGK